jgi:hypothetical protein
MATQNRGNHFRYVPLWHFITSFAMLILLIGSLVNLYRADAQQRLSASLLVLISLIFASVFWYARQFALRAQDRAIRAEENLRHFVLSGKPLDARLRMGQIIALRFAPDEEFLTLAKDAAEKGLTNGAIKKMIIEWRADHHRV